MVEAQTNIDDRDALRDLADKLMDELRQADWESCTLREILMNMLAILDHPENTEKE